MLVLILIIYHIKMTLTYILQGVIDLKAVQCLLRDASLSSSYREKCLGTVIAVQHSAMQSWYIHLLQLAGCLNWKMVMQAFPL